MLEPLGIVTHGLEWLVRPVAHELPQKLTLDRVASNANGQRTHALDARNLLHQRLQDDLLGLGRTAGS